MADEKDNNEEDIEALFQNTEHVSEELPETSEGPSADELFSGKYGSADDQENASASQQELAAKALAESDDEDPFADLDSDAVEAPEGAKDDTTAKESIEGTEADEASEEAEEDIGSLIDAAFADELKRPGENEAEQLVEATDDDPVETDAASIEETETETDPEPDIAEEVETEDQADDAEEVETEDQADDSEEAEANAEADDSEEAEANAKADVATENVETAEADPEQDISEESQEANNEAIVQNIEKEPSSKTLDELLESLEEEVIAGEAAPESDKKSKKDKKKKKKKHRAKQHFKKVSPIRVLILLGLFILTAFAGGYWWLKIQKQPGAFPGLDTLKNQTIKNHTTESEPAKSPQENEPVAPEEGVSSSTVIPVQPDPSRPQTTTLTFYEIPEIRARLGEAGLEVTFSLGIYARNSQIGPDIRSLAPNIKVLVQNIFYLKPSKKLVRDILEKEIQEKLEFLFPKGEIQRVELRNLNSELISP